MTLRFIKRIKGAANEHLDNGDFYVKREKDCVFGEWGLGAKYFSYQNDLSYFSHQIDF